jgi:hypothetical protein
VFVRAANFMSLSCICFRKPLNSFSDFRSLAQLTEQLPKKDRLFVIENAKHLAEFFKDRNNKNEG